MNHAKLFIGRFINSEEYIKDKINSIKALVFDWDGVFTNAHKNINLESTYSELDVFMLNLFKLQYFLKTKTILPTVIITGSQNPTAIHFAKKNYFNAIYYRAINKRTAFNHCCSKLKLLKSDFAFFFDDIVDLSITNDCGLRFMIYHKAKAILMNYIETNKLADYITKTESGNSAVREVLEMLIYMTNSLELTIKHRVNFSESYTEFINEYRKIDTQIFTLNPENTNVIAG
ncbi:MAG: hypothetical protein ACQPRH_01220 [Solitalea-like symbiont of Tyrophagus putrescentiae]